MEISLPGQTSMEVIAYNQKTEQRKKRAVPVRVPFWLSMKSDPLIPTGMCPGRRRSSEWVFPSHPGRSGSRTGEMMGMSKGAGNVHRIGRLLPDDEKQIRD
jgi:hypothetical protein